MTPEERVENLFAAAEKKYGYSTGCPCPDSGMVEDLVREAAAEAAAEEREACAKVAETSIGREGGNAASDFEAARVAETIRARGKS